MRHIIFVYNAQSGRINSFLDSAHKILSPSTYQCSLCQLTHDAVRERDEWSRFRESVKPHNIHLEFLHKDEFKDKKYWSKWLPHFSFPIVLEKKDTSTGYHDRPGDNAGFDILISTEKLDQLQSLDALVDLLKIKLQLA